MERVGTTNGAATGEGAASDSSPQALDPRRWRILIVLGTAQLMVILDATIVNVALPSAQQSLDFSDSNRQWVITAYALAFGSLLLLGGRLGDLFGRKLTLLAGLFGFAGASALGGAATSFEVLIASRMLQGVFAALMAPSALALLNATFHDSSERNKAFAVWGSLAGAGGATGMLLGGVLTEYLSWRWTMFVNIGFALPAAIAAMVLIGHHPRRRPILDIPGTLTGSAGLFLLVLGFSEAERNGWETTETLACLIGGILLLVCFAMIERRARNPLLPLKIISDRTRAGAVLTLALLSAVLYTMTLFLSYFLQGTLGFSPVETGLAFLALPLPITATSILTQTRLMPRFGPRTMLRAGMVFAAAGFVVLAQLDAHSGYFTGVLPGMVLVALGSGMTFATCFNTATARVPTKDAGAAGAVVNTNQQVGGALGIALFSTIAASATTGFLADHPAGADAAAMASTHGFATAFWWAAGLCLLGLFGTASLVRPGSGVAMAAADPAPAA